MPNEKRRIKEIGKKELNTVVGGVGAFTNNFNAQFVLSGRSVTAADGFIYAGGFDGQASGHSYAMIAVYPGGTGAAQAGWNFKFGFPNQAWANNYAGGASDFKAAFIGLYGTSRWKGWGSSQTAEF